MVKVVSGSQTAFRPSSFVLFSRRTYENKKLKRRSEKRSGYTRVWLRLLNNRLKLIIVAIASRGNLT